MWPTRFGGLPHELVVRLSLLRRQCRLEFFKRSPEAFVSVGQGIISQDRSERLHAGGMGIYSLLGTDYQPPCIDRAWLYAAYQEQRARSPSGSSDGDDASGIELDTQNTVQIVDHPLVCVETVLSGLELIYASQEVSLKYGLQLYDRVILRGQTVFRGYHCEPEIQ